MNLRARLELNGRIGTLLLYAAESDRWGVQLERGGNPISVRTFNLILDADADIEASSCHAAPAAAVAASAVGSAAPPSDTPKRRRRRRRRRAGASTDEAA